MLAVSLLMFTRIIFAREEFYEPASSRSAYDIDYVYFVFYIFVYWEHPIWPQLPTFGHTKTTQRKAPQIFLTSPFVSSHHELHAVIYWSIWSGQSKKSPGGLIVEPPVRPNWPNCRSSGLTPPQVVRSPIRYCSDNYCAGPPPPII